MKNLVLIFFALLIVSIANAQGTGVLGYNYWAPKVVREYLDLVDKNAPAFGPSKCQGVYANAISKGQIDIRYALGYFDASTGEERVWEGVNWGLSPSLDIEVFHALRNEMKSVCRTPTMRLCGFSESGDPQNGKVVLQKPMDFHGRPVIISITLTHASATNSFSENLSAAKDRQKFLTQQSEENFFEGLKTADVVFYNGHSRNGGGPDFAPPILDSRLHVNYNGFYEIKRPGILRTLAALKQNPNPGFVLGLYSCYSKKHFFKDLLETNPSQRAILVVDTIDYMDSLKASMGYLEGILRGTCGQELADTAKQDEKIKTGFQGFFIH